MESQHLNLDKAKYGMTGQLGYSSTKDEAETYKKFMKDCLSQSKYQTNVANYVQPTDWKAILKAWVTSDVYDLLCAEHITSLDEFFVEFLERLTKNSHQYDTSMIDWLRKASTPSNIDRQTNEVRSFLKKITGEDKDNIRRVITEAIAIPTQEDVARFTKDQAIAALNNVRNNVLTADSRITSHFNDLLTSHFLMSLISQKPDLFLNWDQERSPKTVKYSELAKFYVRFDQKDIALNLSNKSEANDLKRKLENAQKQNASLQEELKRIKASVNQKGHGKYNHGNDSKNKKKDDEKPGSKPTPKRDRYTGPPCTKCKDAEQAKTHPTDKHKDDYVPKNQFKKQKIDSKK
ncbi:MAG TPA: hypothetical protein VGD31_03465 [Sphingobacteriaceae bacterium]